MEKKHLPLKGLSKQQWLVILLLGLLLVVIAMPTSKLDKAANTTPVLGENIESNSAQDISASQLELQLQQLLEQVEGVGKVQVMLYTGAQDTYGFSSSENTNIQGVLIVAQGADNSSTIEKIKEAVMALFSVEAHKIKVMKMK